MKHFPAVIGSRLVPETAKAFVVEKVTSRKPSRLIEFALIREAIHLSDTVIDSAEEASIESILIRLKRVRKASRVSYEIRNNLTTAAWKRTDANGIAATKP